MTIFLKRTYILEGQLFSHFQEITPLDRTLEKVVVTQMVKNFTAPETLLLSSMDPNIDHILCQLSLVHTLFDSFV
jgi:hypothetical protein